MQKLLILASALCWSVLMAGSGAAQTAVTTYHYDNLRTGWNQTETVLNTANVQDNFGLLWTVPLPNSNDQVDAQPLFVPSQYIAPNSQNLTGGTYDVVFVVTEADNVYAIDASTGNIVNEINLGSPVLDPPGGGGFNGPTMGIYGTPVIDPEAQILYVMAYVNVNGAPTYQLHALDLSTLADKPGNSPLTITASHVLPGVTPPFKPLPTFPFSAASEQQRTGLVFF